MASIPFDAPPAAAGIKSAQKAALHLEPGMKSYLQEQAATNAKTARLKELRLAQAAAKEEPAARKTTVRKKPMRRGIGSS